jgi:hypothetical protein
MNSLMLLSSWEVDQPTSKGILTQFKLGIFPHISSNSLELGQFIPNSSYDLPVRNGSVLEVVINKLAEPCDSCADLVETT